VPEEFQSRLPKYVFTDEKRLDEINYDIDPINTGDEAPNTLHCTLPGMSDSPSRLEDLKKMGVDLQLLAPQERAMRFNYSVDKEMGIAMAHSYNIEIKKIIDEHPDKYFGAALLPLQDMDAGIKELYWAIENGFTTVYVDYLHYSYDTKLCVPRSTVDRIDEIFKICEENYIVLFVHFFMNHNITIDIPEHIKTIANGEKINFIELSFYDLISSDILDKFPKLQLVVTEGAQRVMGKIYKNLYKAYITNPEWFKSSKEPLYYLKNNISYTIDIEMKESFNFLLEYFGSERLLFSTDYPHNDPSGVNKWKDTDDLLGSGLSQKDTENIAFRNAEKLFKINLG
jgi:predicted TIM-barrel fold metal-dependent hydrolase